VKSPLRAILQGLAAGAFGAAVSTAYQELTKNGEATPPRDCSEAPPPARGGRTIVEGVFEEHVPLSRAPRLTQVVTYSVLDRLGSRS
jgi:hypothetical protein